MFHFLLFSFLFWRIFLFAASLFGEKILALRQGFLGLIPWANFDGVHYLSIAQNGYFQYQQAFFPLFPILIRVASKIFVGNYLIISLIIVYLSLIILLILFWKLLRLDFGENIAKDSILFLLFFPSAFFFGSIYTESLFLMLVLAAFYAARKKRWLLVGVLGGLASATRLAGICLLPTLLWEYIEQKEFKIKNLKSNILWLILIPLGLFIYMFYLWRNFGDPLYFFHVQPAFGAQRSGGEIILLPQVIWRYLKIFATVSPKTYDFWPAVWEMVSLAICYLLLAISIKKKVRFSYVLFAFLAVTLPTLTGTLSSMPRYILVAFPMYIVLGMIKNKVVKTSLLVIFSLLLMLFTILFTRGYWVS